MKLQNVNVAYFAGPEYEDLELWVPLMRLQEEGANVTIAGHKAGETYSGKHGIPARADVAFDELVADKYDAVIVPGGWAPDKMRRYDGAKNFLQQMNAQGKVIGMICHAGLVGISAGIVSDHDATGSEGIKDDLINAGARWRDEAAFRSGNLVWGRVVADIPDFCRELMVAITEQVSSKTVQG